MNLCGLLSIVEQTSGFRELETKLLSSEAKDVSVAVPDAARSFLIGALHERLDFPILVITAQPEGAKRVYEELQVWSASSARLYYFPEVDFLADEYSSRDIATTVDRMRTLSALARRGSKSEEGRSPLVVSSALGAINKVMARDEFTSSCDPVKVGMNIPPTDLLKKWQAVGYEYENVVEVPGAMSHRGGIVDVFSPDSELPARIEFVGNRIESIRFFDPKTQRSQRLVTSVTIAPAVGGTRSFGSHSILEHLPDDALVITDSVDELKTTIDKLNDEVEEFRQTMQERGSSPSNSPILDWPEFAASMGKMRRRLTLSAWDTSVSHGKTPSFLTFGAVPSYGGRLETFASDLRQMLHQGRRVVVVSQQTNRLVELLREQDIAANSVSHIEQVPPLRSVTLVLGSLPEGWGIKGVLSLFTDSEIFGFIKKGRSSRKNPIRYHWFISQLTPGDYVVHIEHGVAKFAGLTKSLKDGVEREYLLLEYSAGDRLYVPVDQIDRVSRYIGASDQPPTLSRLGTQEWERTKQRIRESVAVIAQEMLNLYASREIIGGFAFSPDTSWQRELESSFPYVETLDQLEAVKAVKEDMEKAKPMDRLVCGDVGYGKTEVALRAAFKAVMDGKQVALLVPTTVLAQQHFVTFRERLQAFPVGVDMLSRFCSEKEQAETITGLTSGSTDICIGTHRLLQKDVVFRDLGLVIIDEEQRFGVVHKEHFKRLRREVDVLTLSATPIPRTLHMSLTGIRDLSTIETPPEERLPIRTHVGVYDETLVREVILHELERNGQVFFVHNRVYNIAMVANSLSRLVPEARISVAHGRVPEQELEKVMTDFVNRKSDVLVTTTIIESGLDIPSVNTLIVNQADRFGLTQLYQLRGRIGRGMSHAHAYFLFDKKQQLTPEARKRLRIISEATELGAGFAVAMKDLEIRGAGNLLGVEQSGHIAAVGFDLYSQLLAEAVEEAKKKSGIAVSWEAIRRPAPAISLPIEAYLPEDYISDLSTRLSLYQRMVAAKLAQEIEDMGNELHDRFGPLPVPVQNLLYVVEIKQRGSAAMVESISGEDNQIILQFSQNLEIDRRVLFENLGNGIKVSGMQLKLDRRLLRDSWREVLREVLKRLEQPQRVGLARV